MPEPMPLPPAAEAFLRTHIIPADREAARADLKALLETETQPTFRFRALTAQVGEAWIPLAWFIDIGPVIAGLVREGVEAEREGCARVLEATAEEYDEPGAGDCSRAVVALLRDLAGRVRQGERPAPGWVPVVKALPPEGVPVLVWIVPDDATPAYCFIATRHGSEWDDPEGIEVGEWVRTWRPLPPGPEEGEGEG